MNFGFFLIVVGTGMQTYALTLGSLPFRYPIDDSCL